MKWILAAIFAFSAQASFATDGIIFSTDQLIEMNQHELTQIDWKVGDTGNYSLEIGSFIKGTMVMHVREWVAEGPWVEQNLDLMGQKQKVEILFDKNDGSIITMIVNGQKQEVPENNSEIEEMSEANITVPAGTFDCIYVRIRDLDKNQTSEAWINPNIIPIAGLLQQKAPSQFGQVVIKLTSYTKN